MSPCLFLGFYDSYLVPASCLKLMPFLYENDSNLIVKRDNHDRPDSYNISRRKKRLEKFAVC